MLRALSRVHVAHRYSTPRAPVCTVHVTGSSSTRTPHQLHVTGVVASCGTVQVSSLLARLTAATA